MFDNLKKKFNRRKFHHILSANIRTYFYFKITINLFYLELVVYRMDKRVEKYQEERSYPEVCTYTAKSVENCGDFEQGSCLK